MVRNPDTYHDRGKSTGSIGDRNRDRCAAGAFDAGGYGCEDENCGGRGDCTGGGRNACEAERHGLPWSTAVFAIVGLLTVVWVAGRLRR